MRYLLGTSNYRNIIILGTVVAIIMGCATAPKRSYVQSSGINQIRWGIAQEEVKRELNAIKRNYEMPDADSIRQKIEYLSEAAQMNYKATGIKFPGQEEEFMYYFHSGKLYAVVINFNSTLYSTVPESKFVFNRGLRVIEEYKKTIGTPLSENPLSYSGTTGTATAVWENPKTNVYAEVTASIVKSSNAQVSDYTRCREIYINLDFAPPAVKNDPRKWSGNQSRL